MITRIRHLVTRYRPRYVRSLVYMMQASEYYTRDYLRWYHRTGDFAHVEKRKRLDMTAKAKALLGVGYALWLFFILIAVSMMLMHGDALHAVGVVLLIGAPFFLPYLMAVALGVVNALQLPFEWRAMARARRTLRAHKGIKIAIAGSYGKTSMREILKTILSQGKKVAAPGKSTNTPLGIAEFVATLSGDENVLIFEMGEYYPGDIRKLCALVEPDWGIITGVNEAHLERFGSMQKTIGTIFELAAYLGHKPLYINGESIQARAKAAQASVVYDRHRGAREWRVVSAQSGLDGVHIHFELNGKNVLAHAPILGLHNVGPIAAAGDIASRLGVSEEHVLAGIAALRPFEHRMQPRTVGDIALIDDSYNGNPDGVAAAIDVLKGLSGRRWYLTPGLVEMGVRSEDVHLDIGRQLAESGIEKVGLMRDSVTPFIERGLISARFKGEIVWFDTMPLAIDALPHLTLPGDIVLIQNDWPDQYV